MTKTSVRTKKVMTKMFVRINNIDFRFGNDTKDVKTNKYNVL